MNMPTPNPALASLEPLIGLWEMEAVLDGDVVMRGRSEFAWAEQGAFLIQTADGDATPGSPWEGHTPFPTVAITGFDDAFETYSVLYSDARGVLRIYAMSFADGVLKQWRDAPEFHQRFTGELSADSSRIDARWEMSEDGEEWRVDFDLTYTRVS